MIDAVSLSLGTRQVLYSQQRTAALTNETANHLATGNKVQSALDSPSAFYQARSLSNRASDLLAVKDGIGKSLHTVEAASVGLNALSRTVDQLHSIAAGARGGSAAERQAAAQLFDKVSQQLDNISSDNSYAGVNLTGSPSQSLEVTLNEKGETLTVAGSASDRSGLGIGIATTDYSNLATDADIDAALAALKSATSTIRAREQSFSTDVSILNVREQFSEDLGNTLQVGSDQLVEADLAEESVNLLALQVRQKLGNVALNLINEKNNSVASLF